MKTRKIFAAVLALALAMGLSTTAFAASPSTHTTVPSTETIGVNGSYSGTGTASDVYSVKIEWGEMSFTYKTTGDKTWDPETHTYNVADDDGWEAVGNEVKVTNHSNVDVKATFTYAPESGNTLTGAFTYDNGKTADSTGAVSLAAGVEGQVSAADYVTAALKLSGTPSSTMTDFTKVGTITVKITK